VPGEGAEHVLVGGRDAVRRQRATQRREDARLPVDERAVAVEREHVEAVEVERGHGR